MLQIRWHGHACFEISNEVTIVTDPHDGKSLGIPPPTVQGDIILVSHDHFDHNSVKTVEKENSTIIRDPKEREVSGVKIRGVTVYHDEAKGAKRGENNIYIFTLDGVTFCHLGDLGHTLDKEVVEEIGKIDILFIPVGGTYTVDAKQAWEVAKSLNPRIIVPMHYKIEGLSLPIATVDEFLDEAEYKVLKVGNEIDIEKEELPEEPEIWVFTL